MTWWFTWYPNLYQLFPLAAKIKSWMLQWRKLPHLKWKTHRMMLSKILEPPPSRNRQLKVKRSNEFQTFKSVTPFTKLCKSFAVKPSRSPPRRALKKLLDRIRSQRNQWTHHSSCVPVADSPTIITDQIPERDTSIETGSLISEEKDEQTPTNLGQPAHSPPSESTVDTVRVLQIGAVLFTLIILFL